MIINFEQAKQDILQWVTNFVERPHPMLNNWAPCPYARKARIENKFDIRLGISTPEKDLGIIDMETFDVIAYVYNPEDFSAEEFNQSVDSLNQNFLVPKGMLALADHPADIEVVNGVTMNQGTWAICFLQNLEKLNSHAKMLAEKGYYNNWPDEYLKNLFQFRKDPRN